jgi:hypothetical protein
MALMLGGLEATRRSARAASAECTFVAGMQHQENLAVRERLVLA